MRQVKTTKPVMAKAEAVRGKSLMLLPVLLFLATACATLSEEQCLDLQNSSWEFVGQNDGKSGYDPEQRLNMHREACSKVGVNPDRQSYLIGWNRGILSYCDPDNGFYLGQKGYSENSYLCPIDSREEFLFRYNHGRDLYEMQREAEELRREMEDLERRMQREDLDRKSLLRLHDQYHHCDHKLNRLYYRIDEARKYPW